MVGAAELEGVELKNGENEMDMPTGLDIFSNDVMEEKNRLQLKNCISRVFFS